MKNVNVLRTITYIYAVSYGYVNPTNYFSTTDWQTAD